MFPPATDDHGKTLRRYFKMRFLWPRGSAMDKNPSFDEVRADFLSNMLTSPSAEFELIFVARCVTTGLAPP
jgi:hypothetical protein